MGNFNGPPAASVLPKVSGVVHGGQSPISGATIQLYAANPTTNPTTSSGGASTAMLTQGVTTGPDGSFTITNLYTCPASNPLVYLVSTGGNPGLQPVTVNNPDITLMAALGPCLTSLNSFTYIVINELTTVAAAQALAPFMTDVAHVGTSPADLTSIAGQFQQASTALSTGTGQFSGNLSVEDLELTTWANILAACVNTSGGTSGDTTPCGKLLQFAGGTDTITAALHMVQSPTNNASTLYGLIVGTPPFQPYFTGVPSDLTVTVGSPLPANIHAATFDSTGQIWLYTAGFSYNTVTGIDTDIQGTITVYDNNFVQRFTIPTGTPGPGGLYYPVSMTADAAGHVFVVNANNTISEFNSNGTAVSPSAGWSTGVATTFTGSGNIGFIGYVNGSNQVNPIRVDKLGNIWGVTSSGCYVEMNSAGTVVVTPAGAAAFCTTAGTISSIEPDGAGNAWTFGNSFIGNSTISKVNSSGALAGTATYTSGCFYPYSVAHVGNPTGFFYVETNSLRYDHVHDQLWGSSYTGAGTVTDSGAFVFCDSGPATLPVILPYTSTTNPYSAGSLLSLSGVLDGGGNFWFVTGGVAASGVLGGLPGTFTGTVTYSTYLSKISPSGALVTPYNVSTNTFGLQPSGVGVNATASSTNGSVSPASFSVVLLGVDVNGNIWAEDLVSNRVIKIPGATANTQNY